MAIKQFPIVRGTLAFSFKIDLDNRPFEFVFSFNTRSELWTFDIFNDAGDVLIYKVPIFVNQILLSQFQSDLRLPQGALFALNLVSENENPGRDNFGSDVVLLYREI